MIRRWDDGFCGCGFGDEMGQLSGIGGDDGRDEGRHR